MTLATIRTKVTGRGKWTRPEFGQPVQINAADLEPLGTVGGRTWYMWKRKNSELREQPRRYRDAVWIENGTPGEGDVLQRAADVLPDGPFSVETTADGERVYVGYQVMAPGSYAAAMSKPAITPRVSTPHVLDALAGFSMLRRRGKAIGDPSTVVAGPADILAHLKRQGYDIRLSSDGADLVVSAPHFGVVREVLDVARPLLLAHLRGEPMTCTVSAHKKPTAAVTIALGGAGYCGRCEAGGKS